MRPPIIVIGEGDIDVFADPDHVSVYVEAVDVLDGVYSGAWDRDGRRMELAVEQRPYKGLFGFGQSEVVVVHEAPGSTPLDPEFDREILRRLPQADIPDAGNLRGAALIEHVLSHAKPVEP